MSLGTMVGLAGAGRVDRREERFERGLDRVLTAVLLTLGVGLIADACFADLSNQPWLYIGVVVIVLSLLRTFAFTVSRTVEAEMPTDALNQDCQLDPPVAHHGHRDTERRLRIR